MLDKAQKVLQDTATRNSKGKDSMAFKKRIAAMMHTKGSFMQTPSTYRKGEPSGMCPCLQSQGMPEPKVEIQAMYRANQNIDVTVAAEDLRAGDTVLRIPEHLIITLKGVFEDEVWPRSSILVLCPGAEREGEEEGERGRGCRGRWPCFIDKLRIRSHKG